MSKTFFHKDFSAGWCPSDSPLNARPNGLLTLDGVELDQNGEIVMTGGLKTLISGYGASAAHTIFPKFLGSSQFRYTAHVDGTVRRDNTNITTGGSSTRAAFAFAYDYIMAFSATKRIRDDGTTTTNLGQVKASTPLTISLNGVGDLEGNLQYIQVNVFRNGAYIAKSAPNTMAEIVASSNKVQVTAQAPTSPANEVWIFRRDELTDGDFYRVKRLLSNYTTPFDDNVLSEDALLENITLNVLALSINSTDLPDDILDAVGPINGRMLYFTKNTLYPSEINSPESYVPGQGIQYSGNTNGSEVFLFAKKVGRKTTVVGTTKDVYIINGTFVTLPDGSLDIYLDNLGVHDPPINIDAAVYNTSVVYMGNSGWTQCSLDGNTIPLIDERLDRLYRGETTLSMGLVNRGIPIYIAPALGPGSVVLRYSCAIARDKLWCRLPCITASNPALTFSSVMHIYDFKRKYWRVMTANTPDILVAQEDGAVIGYYSSDGTIREINHQFAKTNDGTNQTITLQFPSWVLNSPRTRKDLYTLKFKIYTGGAAVTVQASSDGGQTNGTLSVFSTSTLQEAQIDLIGLIDYKSIQLSLIGTLPDFRLADISIDYDERPEQQTSVRYLRWDGLKGQKFRPRVWPIIIDTFGLPATFTPSMDGSGLTTSTIITNGKRTHLHYFNTDVFGKDLGFTLAASNLFELYEVGNPEIVQVLPMSKRFDQLGPEEFFKYGKIKALRVRLLSSSSGNIPYTIYFQDSAVFSGILSVIANVEDVYEVGIGKTIAGTISRIELGPTAFDFFRYYAEIQVAKSGRDTEMEWVVVGAQSNG